MVGKVESLNRSLYTRRCVACGYDGALLKGGRAERCARCCCDLQLRPARSYAEMEGLLGEPAQVQHERPFAYEPRWQERLVHRWLAFLFFSLLMVIAIGYLTAAALPV